MKKRSVFFALFIVFILAFSLTACGGGDEEAAPEEQPSWTEMHEAMVASGEGEEHEYYNTLYAELNDIVKESGAFYVYALLPTDGEGPSADGDPDSAFAITVDGSDDPDEYGCEYEWEIQFREAWEGEPAAARSAWNDSDTEQCWSAFAPVTDADGNVVCILGVDYPCTDVIKENPDWNRDGDSWNGFKDEIKGEVPEAVQSQIDEVISIADKYAKQLSD